MGVRFSLTSRSTTTATKFKSGVSRRTFSRQSRCSGWGALLMDTKRLISVKGPSAKKCTVNLRSDTILASVSGLGAHKSLSFWRDSLSAHSSRIDGRLSVSSATPSDWNCSLSGRSAARLRGDRAFIFRTQNMVTLESVVSGICMPLAFSANAASPSNAAPVADLSR